MANENEAIAKKAVPGPGNWWADQASPAANEPGADSQIMRDRDLPSYSAAPIEKQQQMIRTQVYLTRAEHEFLQAEGNRRGAPMAAVLREIIDQKMAIPDDIWTNNSLLEPTAADPDYEGHEDSSLNHEHYAYGAPKKYGKRNGRWALLPLVNE